MLFNIAEKAWLEAPIYNRAMDNYQTFLARKQQKAGGDATPNPSQTKIQDSIKKIFLIQGNCTFKTPRRPIIFRNFNLNQSKFSYNPHAYFLS